MAAASQALELPHFELDIFDNNDGGGDVEALLEKRSSLGSICPLEDDLKLEEHEVVAGHDDRLAVEHETSGIPATPSTTATVILLLLWLAISCSLIMSNKYILHALNFGYPVTLTCWHQVYVACLTQVPVFQGKVSEPDRLVSQKEYFRVIIPIAALFALSLICNNLPYLSLSMSFIQMLKGLGPATALLAMWSLGLESPDVSTCLNIGVVVAGAFIASLGEVKFALGGFVYQILGLLFDGYRLGLTRKLLSGDKKLQPMTAMAHMAPPSALMLGLVAAVTEWPAMTLQDLRNVGTGIFLINGALAFLLNFVVFRLISRTSALTLPLCGELKKVLIVMTSVIFWGEVVTPVQFLGYTITSVGLLLNMVGIEKIRGAWKSITTRKTQLTPPPPEGSVAPDRACRGALQAHPHF